MIQTILTHCNCIRHIPALTFVFSLFIMYFSPFFQSPIFPELSFICIYYWGIYAPYFLSIWILGLISLPLDMISGFPFGVHSSVFLSVKIVALSQRTLLFKRGFFNIWAGFALCSFVGTFVKVSLYFLLYSSLSLFSVGVRYWLTIMIFPLFVRFLMELHQHFFPAPTLEK